MKPIRIRLPIKSRRACRHSSESVLTVREDEQIKVTELVCNLCLWRWRRVKMKGS